MKRRLSFSKGKRLFFCMKKDAVSRNKENVFLKKHRISRYSKEIYWLSATKYDMHRIEYFETEEIL